MAIFTLLIYLGLVFLEPKYLKRLSISLSKANFSEIMNINFGLYDNNITFIKKQL